ncbi:acyl-CoA thioesterase [Symbioplanes lichenis]|uniref:acyl-CoA thioesterase n=1 Tax=Symbioplanes lichenis TaxID=1629072 RepID=UPI0027392EBD|nr:thioesterase family protein [Actinoplanes lichenis]
MEHVDTDASGSVHFSRYPSLLETAALESLEGLGWGPPELDGRGLDLVVAELAMRYHGPARYRDDLDVTVLIDYAGAARFRFRGDISRPGTSPPGVPPAATTLAGGTILFCVVDRATGRATGLPADMSTLLKGLASRASQ